MRKKSISRFIFFVLLSLLFFSIAPVSADEQNTVLVVKLSNAITPASDQILKEAINEA